MNQRTTGRGVAHRVGLGLVGQRSGAVSRSIFAIVDDRDRAYFGGAEKQDHFGYIDPEKRTIFGSSYADEPDILIKQLTEDEAIGEADTLLLTVPTSWA